MREKDEEKKQSLLLAAARVFSPTAPIDERSLFAGRDAQVGRVIDAINQKGQHAMIYGERGVGKTSLANVLAEFLKIPSVSAPRVNCEGSDSFDSVWRKIFEKFEQQARTRRVGFGSQPEDRGAPVAEHLAIPDPPATISTETVRKSLELLSERTLPIVIVDEFDRLPSETKQSFADAIKTLSDHAIAATVILVGVADSVEELISGHQSVERALVQVRMPRMSIKEIVAVIQNGLTRLKMTIDLAALDRIVLLSQGLPHYTHLICLYASKRAIESGSSKISNEDVEEAIKSALEGAQQSIRSDWHRATMSPRKDNLFSDVLLACSIAKTDDLGYFAAQDVRKPLREVTGRPYEITSFSQHLNDFCDEKRGPVLQKIGTRRRYRFRFANPLMQPFVVMQGISSGRLKKALALSSGSAKA